MSKQQASVARGNPDPLHSLDSSAKYLGDISRNTVKRYLWKKMLSRVKVGGRTMIRQSELDRFIKAGEEK